MNSLTNLLLLVLTILFSGCAAVEYGGMLYDHTGDLMSLNEERGKRFYDVYFDYLFISPSNAPKAKVHFQKHGFPDYIYCEGQLSNYLIHSNDQLKIFHFEQSLIGLLVVKQVTIAGLPYAVQNQLSKLVSLQKQQIERQELKDERQRLEERWRNEYLQELSDAVM